MGVGGALGAVARYLIVSAAQPMPATLAINLAGAFVLGLVTARLAGHVNLFLGTGMLGGFTTYSAFAVGAVQLLDHSPAAALAYVLATVLGGFLMAYTGLKLVGGRRPANNSRRSGDNGRRPANSDQRPAKGAGRD